MSPLGPSTCQNAASLHSLFCKVFCFGTSVSAIQFTCYLFLACAITWLSTGTAEDERCNHMLLQYSCTQLFKMTPARLTLDLISHLHSMQIGVDLPSKRSWWGGEGNKNNPAWMSTSHLCPSHWLNNFSLIERSISDDQDLFAEIRLEIPVRTTDHVHHATTVCQSCVNFNNLISITTQHSRVSVNRS